MSTFLKTTSTLLLFVIIASIKGVPTCTYSNKTHLVCTSTDSDDYILQRGLVSDSNTTTSISLRGCRISEVELESFENLFFLKSLDLSENKISIMELGVLDGSATLTHLNLSYNSITELPLGLFDQKPNIMDLDLAANKLNNPQLGTFDELKNLKHLDLSYNTLQGNGINPYLFDQNRYITNINFSGNDMNDSPVNLLHAFQTLAKLYLNQCLLNKIPSFVKQRNLKTLKQLEFSKNLISKIDNASEFVDLENLEKLDLSENIIEDINEHTFKSLKKIKVIILRKNKVAHLSKTLFQNMQSLGNIDLSFNLVSVVPVDAFRGTSLKNLNLSNNRLTYLVDNFCLELRNSGARLNKFFFNQNPWQCSCLKDILNEVKKFQIDYNSVHYDGEHRVCVTTGEYNCKRHSSFNDMYTSMYDNLVITE